MREGLLLNVQTEPRPTFAFRVGVEACLNGILGNSERRCRVVVGVSKETDYCAPVGVGNVRDHEGLGASRSVQPIVRL